MQTAERVVDARAFPQVAIMVVAVTRGKVKRGPAGKVTQSRQVGIHTPVSPTGIAQLAHVVSSHDALHWRASPQPRKKLNVASRLHGPLSLDDPPAGRETALPAYENRGGGCFEAGALTLGQPPSTTIHANVSRQRPCVRCCPAVGVYWSIIKCSRGR